ncbi:RHS repeat-associated core domain-containing protein [Myxococcota bacterium]|nr:RHS repeat-associated core domain-containing protein [Myxococcota bacterium]
MVYDPVRPHQIRSWAGRTYTHENHGGAESRTLVAGGPPQEFGYDSFRRLTQMSRPASGGGVESASFGYDYADRRVSRVRDGNTELFFHRYLEAREGMLVKYYFLGDRLIASNRVVFAQASGPGAPLSLPPWTAAALALSCGFVMVLILWAPGRREVRIGIVVARSRAAGTTALLVLFPAIPVLLAPQCGGGPSTTRHFYHLDRVGSTQLVTLASGGVHEEIRYHAWGEIRGRWDGLGTPIAPSQESRFEWNGYETEHGWALEYAGARFYDSGIGQFLSHDPAGQYASPYAYGPGDPANGSDPSGASFLGFLGNVVKVLLGGLSGSYTSGGGGAGFGTSVSFGGGGPGEGGEGGSRANGDGARAPNGATAPIQSYGLSTVVAVGSAIAGLANSGADTAGGAFAAGGDAGSLANGLSQSGVRVAGGNELTDAQALQQAQDELVDASPAARRVEGMGNIIDVEAGQRLVVTVKNPTIHLGAFRIEAGAAGEGPIDIVLPEVRGGGVAPGLSTSVEFTRFGTPPLLFRLRVDAPNIPLNLRFQTVPFDPFQGLPRTPELVPR